MYATDTAARARRILVEDEDPTWYRLMVKQSDPEEYEFRSCRGPLLEPGGCPMLHGESCPKIEWADTVLQNLDAREPANRSVLATLRHDWREIPLPACAGGLTMHWLDRKR